MKYLDRIRSFFSRNKERIGIVVVGFLGVFGSSYLFDYFLYPLVIWKMGIIKGGVIMMMLSGLICYAFLLFYDRTKKDWLGIETLKEIKDSEGNSRIGKFIRKLVRKSDNALLVFLSIKFDPLITMLYMRRGAHRYNGLTGRDWKIFGASLFIGNVYWTLAAYMGVSVIEYLWGIVAKA